jgi:hypothetical protein
MIKGVYTYDYKYHRNLSLAKNSNDEVEKMEYLIKGLD